MTRGLLVSVLLIATLQAEPPVVDQATLYPEPNGSMMIGVRGSSVTTEQAVAVTWGATELRAQRSERFVERGARRPILLLSLASPPQAGPPVIGQATLYPGPNGSTTIGVHATGMTREQAVAATWVLEVDGQTIQSSRAECEDYYAVGYAPLCHIPVPLMAHVGAVRVRAAGSSEWSNVWAMAMVPCGAFVGETLFSKGHELMGWMPSLPLPVGAPCASASDEQPQEPPTCPTDAVSVLVGDWTRTVTLGARGRVTYSLQLSTTPVTTLVVKFNGLEHDRLTGSDLRNVAGSYFKVPTVRGTYPLVIEASTAAGCVAVASRPMSVNVK